MEKLAGLKFKGSIEQTFSQGFLPRIQLWKQQQHG